MVPDLNEMQRQELKLQGTKGPIKLIKVILTFFSFMEPANLEHGGRVRIIMIIIMPILEQGDISN